MNATAKFAKYKWRLVVGLLAVVLMVTGWWLLTRPPRVTNFDQCVAAGYPVAESYPETCQTPDGRIFVNPAQQSAPVSASPVVNQTFQILVSGDSGADTDPMSFVIRSRGEWQAIWETIHSHVQPRPALLEVDFGKEMVVGVLMGRQSSGGYSIRIASVLEGAERLMVQVDETAPGAGCVTTQTLTNPYHLVRTARSDKPVDFKTDKTTKVCR